MSEQATNQVKPSVGSAIGPVLGATVITRSLHSVLPAYERAGFQRIDQSQNWGHLPPPLAQAFTRRAWLASDSGRPWLQLIEIPNAPDVDPYRNAGWFSLEVGSSDVHALAAELANCDGFQRLSGPAPLAISDTIMAMQAIGPAGELYYFTEIKQPLPPFELPVPVHLLDELFIAVATTADRHTSALFWQSLNDLECLRLNTEIGVLNRALGLPEIHQFPVALAQLGGATLIEIDQIPEVRSRPSLTTGIAMISVAADRNQHVQGTSAEWVELVADVSVPRPQPR